MNEIQMFSNYPDVVTIEQLMEMLGVGRNSAYRLINEKRIKTVSIGRKHIIPKKCVIDFLELN